MNTLFTRSRAEAWRAANPTPAPAQLHAFLAADARPLPCMPTPGMDSGGYKLGLYLVGAVVLGVIGSLL